VHPDLCVRAHVHPYTCTCLQAIAVGSFVIEAHLKAALGCFGETFRWQPPVSVTLHRPPVVAPSPSSTAAAAVAATAAAGSMSTPVLGEGPMQGRRDVSPIRTGPSISSAATATATATATVVTTGIALSSGASGLFTGAGATVGPVLVSVPPPPTCPRSTCAARADCKA
jgi:hypothetical protein